MAKIFILLQLLLLQLRIAAAAAGQATQARDSLFVKVAHHRSQIRRSFTFAPHAFGERVEDIRLVGNAAVMGDGSIKIPALDRQANQAGRALFASPVRMWDPNTSLPASFDTSFSFVINQHQSRSSSSSRSTNSSTQSHESGGGLAFIIAPDEMTVGREGPYLGMMLSDACVHRNHQQKQQRFPQQQQQQHPVIAVEFDTFKDAEFGDPNDNHVGLNLGSVVSDETADLSNAGVYLRNGSLVTARISYDSSSQHLEVRVTSSGSSGQQELQDDSTVFPLISSPVDLSSFLKEYMFVGFSASTGAEALSHTVLSWNFSCASHAVQRFPSSGSAAGDGSNDDSGSFTSKQQLSRAECQDAIVEDKFDRDSSNKKTHPPPAFFVFISVSATFLFIILNVLVFWRRNRIHHNQLSNSGDQWSLPVVLLPRPRPLHKPREFDAHELLVATGDFAEKQKLGEGPLGAVYRGSLQDGSVVAIKKFNSSSWIPASGSSVRGFFCIPSKNRKQNQRLVSEILPALSRLRHPNLVSLRGWVCSSSELSVVYEYMPNASLDKWLHPAEALLTLPWIHRWKLARDVAVALQYLHGSGFVHGRLKSSNVLLDITFQARLGDFGLSNDKNSSLKPASTTTNCSAAGGDQEYYVPPEIQQAGTVPWSAKMDVFGFGIICLELVTGGPPDAGLVDRAWLLHEESGSLSELLDSRLERGFNRDQAMVLCGLGLLCTHPDPNSRPPIEAVVSLLDRRTEIPHIPSRIS